MQNQSIEQVIEGAAQVNVTGFSNCFAFALALTDAGMIPTARPGRNDEESWSAQRELGRAPAAAARLATRRGGKPSTWVRKTGTGYGPVFVGVDGYSGQDGGDLVQGRQIGGQAIGRRMTWSPPGSGQKHFGA